ncbi:MAG: hypothetical protein QOC56_1516 [Alphaproteobacteria bacterium]|nr:hypothetical protein [Alphaproteobacteria bacterium]
MEDPPSARRRRRWPALVWPAALLLVVAATLYACWPRQPDLTAFDPDSMARRETAMWRDYYDTRYFALFHELYAVSREQYNFSPFDSLRIAYAAASAARAFQPSRSRAEAEAALPSLITYFSILSRGTSAAFDVREAARTELAWWQARREAVPPVQYGLMIAQVAALLYGVDNDILKQAGVVRAQAMAYRDAHDEGMSEADWSIISEHLRMAYGLLRRALSVRTA